MGETSCSFLTLNGLCYLSGLVLGQSSGRGDGDVLSG